MAFLLKFQLPPQDLIISDHSSTITIIELIQLIIFLNINGPTTTLHQVQKITRRYTHARMQPRSMFRLRSLKISLLNEEKKTCECTVYAT